MDISVIIPTYEKLDKIPKTLEALCFDGEFEVIVAGDKLSKVDRNFLKRKRVKTTFSDERRGKVRAMTDAVKMSSGKLLIFIDSDTRPENRDFLKNIWKVYTEKNFDLATGKLMIEGSSFLERTINVEYLFMNTAFFVTDKMKKVMPVCGALLIMSRKTFNKVGGFSDAVVEDLDMGFKVSRFKVKFGYIKEAGVFTSSPKKLKDWWTQRKRWWSGAAQTFKGSRKDIIRNLPSNTASAGTYYPLPTVSLISIFLVMLFSNQFSLSHVLSIAAFLAGSWMWWMNKVLDWGISLMDGLSYIFLYGPMLTVITISSILYFSIKKANITDWKV